MKKPRTARTKPTPPPAVDASGAVPDVQIANGAAMRAEWDDPDDTRTVGSRTVRQVHGFRRADPLVSLHKRSPRDVTEQHLRAAERLRDDWEMSQGARRKSGTGNGDVGIITAQMMAATRYRAAVAAMGASLWSILRLIVLDGWTVRAWALKFGWKEHRAAGYLIAALDALHDHYNPPTTRGTRNLLDANAGNVTELQHASGRAPGDDG